MQIPQISIEEMSLRVFASVSEKVGSVSTLYTPTSLLQAESELKLDLGESTTEGFSNEGVCRNLKGQPRFRNH